MYSPLSVNTHYSLMRGYGKPDKLLKQCANFGYKSCAITDYDLLSGSVNFYKEAVKNDIKPIIGTKIKIINGANSGYLTFYVMNLAGWKRLIYLSSISYLNPEPCLQINQILDEANLIVVTGDIGSLMDESSVDLLKDCYGERFLVGIQQVNKDISVALADNKAIKKVAFDPVMYVDQKDKFNQLLMYSSHLGIKAATWHAETDSDFQRYYAHSFSLPSPENAPTEFLDGVKQIDEMCEKYSILGRPNPPKYDCPNGLTESEYLLELSRAGWKKRFSGQKLDNQKIYVDRIQKELSVIQKAGLEGYFLIVQDYVNWARQRMLVGPGRGSAAGCLLSYLIGITNVDPIPYKLRFERFYNDGRNTVEKVSIPDIDMDFPPNKRESIIEYIKSRVGPERTCQVATFSGLQGRGALKEVFRVYDVCDIKKMDDITKRLPQKDKISDKLEADQETSIIRWTLKNEPKNLQEFCVMNDDGTLVGDYARYFESAIEIESTYKSYGKHASALVVSGTKLVETCPMIKEKSGNELISGIEFTEMEELGLVKLDILGLSGLSKLEMAKKLLKDGAL